jgi:predicted MFS family arabinose efflux permease
VPDRVDDVALWRIPGLRALALLSVLAFTSFFLTLSSLPVQAVAGGASVSSAGVVTTALLVATVVCQLTVPAAERRLGMARLLALGLVALGAPAPLYLAGDGLVWLSAVSAVRGIGFAILTVAGATLTARLAPPGRRGEAIGLYGLSIAVPNLLAVPGGASLALGGHFAWVAVGATLPLLALPLVRAFGEATAPARPSGGGRTAVRAVVPACVVLAAVTVTGGGIVTFLPVERREGAIAGISLFAFGACGALARWRIGRIADRTGGVGVLLAGALVVCATGVVAVALGLSEDVVVLLAIGAGVAGAGYGAAQNLTLMAALSRAGPAQAGTASASWNAAFDTGTALGAWGVGVVAGAGAGLSAAYLVCAALLVLAIPLGATAARRR